MLLPKKDKGDSRNLNSRASSHIFISLNKKYLGKKFIWWVFEPLKLKTPVRNRIHLHLGFLNSYMFYLHNTWWIHKCDDYKYSSVSSIYDNGCIKTKLVWQDSCFTQLICVKLTVFKSGELSSIYCWQLMAIFPLKFISSTILSMTFDDWETVF